MSGPTIDPDAVRQAAQDFADPETGRSVVTMEQLTNVAVNGDKLSATLALTTHSAPLWEETRENFRQHLQRAFPDLTSVDIQAAVHERPPTKIGEIGLEAKTVLAVGSGKGGVGKSTIAAALAFGLHRAGCRVGFMDADVYGPSVPHLVGIEGRPEVDEATRKIQPKYKDGMPIMSMGLLLKPDEAVVWRGPMLHGAIAQFLRDTSWGPLDYLVIDMPPGTGDVALTLSQLLQRAGAVIVCTPQDVALLDAVKAISMFGKVNIPILGMVENMSGFLCPSCNKKYDIFGSGGARQRAEQLGVPFLGEVPINIGLREKGDQGRVGEMFDDESIAPYLKQLSYGLAKNLAETNRDEPPMPSLNVL